MSRIAKFQKQKKHSKAKILVGVLFLTTSIGGGIGVAFADSDINALLSNWFNKKGAESMSSIEQAIMSEKEIQKERLKQELQLELANSQKQLSDFTEQEKKQRVQAIQDYANQLIANLKIDNSAQEEQIKQQLGAIIEKAESEMDQIGSSSVPATKDSPKQPDAGSNPTDDEKPQQESSADDSAKQTSNDPQQETSTSDKDIPTTNEKTDAEQSSPSEVADSTDTAANHQPPTETTQVVSASSNTGVTPIQ